MEPGGRGYAGAHGRFHRKYRNLPCFDLSFLELVWSHLVFVNSFLDKEPVNRPKEHAPKRHIVLFIPHFDGNASDENPPAVPGFDRDGGGEQCWHFEGGKLSGRK
jgi:hypothetical protein